MEIGLTMKLKYFKITIKIIAIIVVIGIIVYVNRLAVGNDAIIQFATKFGYGSIFLVSIASGFNVLVPIPIIGFFPLFIEAGFLAPLLIITISVGMLLGDVFGYIIGNLGKDMVQGRKKQGKIIKRLTQLRERHAVVPFIILFLYASFVPLPNELIVIPMAFMGYRLVHIVGILLIGNIIFNTLAAFGFVSINSLL